MPWNRRLTETMIVAVSSLLAIRGWTQEERPSPGSPDSGGLREAADLRRITTDPAEDFEPKWSPDGSTLSYASMHGGKWNVWLVPAKGGDPTQLTTDLEYVHSTWWSPAGDEIAIAPSTREGSGFRGFIQIFSLRDRTLKKITDGPVDGAPCWSPDGKSVAFVSDRSGNWDLWRVPCRGGEAVQLTTFPGFDHSPRWSPDGKKIAYQSARSGGGDIWILSVATGTETRLTTSPAMDHFPTWSPDGETIAFHSNRGGNFDIWSIPAGGGEAVQLTSGPAQDVRPAWSPDGKQIAFNSDRSGNNDIWVLELPAAESGKK